MAAPTPTSALVHSSTLVTAGIVVIRKFMGSIITNKIINIILWVGVFTILLAGVSALVEEDVKKIVALSTLSQIGLCIATLGAGYS
jgi:NADH:ubiquinone oxidoreductase subunit 5 (subunit L)/multisubunit Na+/H+ antiporter MnhA subunit